MKIATNDSLCLYLETTYEQVGYDINVSMKEARTFKSDLGTI